MKTVSLFLLFAIISSFFYSCKKQAIPPPHRVDEKWALEKIDYDYYNLAGELVFSESEGNRSGSYMLLFADLKFDLFYQRELTQGTYTLGNNKLNLSYVKPSSGSNPGKDTTVNYSIIKKKSAEFSFYSEKEVPTGKEKATLFFTREY
jgi:hypothetical protein